MTGIGALAALGFDPVVALAFGLLVAGVVASLLPGVPAPLLSLAGVVLYWWSTGYAQPGTVLLVALVGVGLLALAADWLGGVVAARVGGASNTTAILAGLAGLLLFPVAGPVGIVAGSAGTVFVLEYLKGRDANASARAAGAYVLGAFASAAVQFVLTLSMLLTVALVALL